MGLGDMFKATKNAELEKENSNLRSRVSDLEQENSTLRSRVSDLERLLTPEILDYENLIKLIDLETTTLTTRKGEVSKAENELERIRSEIQQANAELIEVTDEVLLQSFGLYEPTFDFATSDIYKDRLDKIRDQQKTMIKNDTAVTGSKDWTVNGSDSKGRKMISDMKKLLLRAFNGECDELVSNVKFNNLDSALKRIDSSVSAISKLGAIMNIAISQKYCEAKKLELQLAYEYQVKKQEEKELQKEERARLREEARIQKEMEAERKKLEKEQTHYQNAYKTLELQIKHAAPEEIVALQEKLAEIEAHLGDVSKSIADVDYRAANQRAGYVYIISNIGAFGENVYKIGMTRRLEPMERINELGDASVPFNFDVHAMIFSDDAPKLESALHEAFADKKLNMINTRREFFEVTLDEIEAEVKKNYDKTVEFTRIAPAEQYRQSEMMRKDNAAVTA